MQRSWVLFPSPPIHLLPTDLCSNMIWPLEVNDGVHRSPILSQHFIFPAAFQSCSCRCSETINAFCLIWKAGRTRLHHFIHQQTVWLTSKDSGRSRGRSAICPFISQKCKTQDVSVNRFSLFAFSFFLTLYST